MKTRLLSTLLSVALGGCTHSQARTGSPAEGGATAGDRVTEQLVGNTTATPPTRPSDWIVTSAAEAKISNLRSWSIGGELPSVAGQLTPYTTDDPWLNGLVADAAQLVGARTLKLSAQLQCYAREHGRFFLLYGARPSAPLQRFIAGRCGVIGMKAATMHRTVDGSISTADALAVRDELLTLLAGLPSDASVAIARTDSATHTVHTLVYAVGGIEVEPFPIVQPGQERVIVRGRLAASDIPLQAVATHGRLGWSWCRYRSTDREGGFSLRCRLDETRDTTTIVFPFSHDRHIWQGSTANFVIATRGEAREYTLESVTTAQVEEAASDRLAILHAINLARQQRGVLRVHEDSVRSVQAEVLWDPSAEPYASQGAAALAFYDLGNDPRVVPSDVAWMASAGSVSAGQFVDEALSEPRLRSILLGAASRFALTTRTLPGQAATQAIVVAY